MLHVERTRALVVREGTQKDIPSFYRLHTSSSKRNGFTPYSEAYYQKLWETFATNGYLKLFLSEYDSKPVSAALAITFKDSVIGYKIGWSGAYSNLKPNDAVDWETIRWAKTNGYHYFDLGGIEEDVAQAALNKEDIPNWAKNTYNSLKLSYGGNIYFYPDTFDHINNPFLNWGYRIFYPWIKRTFDPWIRNRTLKINLTSIWVRR